MDQRAGMSGGRERYRLVDGKSHELAHADQFELEEPEPERPLVVAAVDVGPAWARSEELDQRGGARLQRVVVQVDAACVLLRR